MSFTGLILTNLGIVAVLMMALWLLSLLKKDASVVDPCWGLGFVILVWSTSFQVGMRDTRSYLLAALVTIWGLRLSGYLAWRNYGEGEDKRYTKMRKKHGERFWWISLFTVFLLQGALMWFISLTFQSGIYWSQTSMIGWFAMLGIAIWGIGFFFESVGDFQMARFQARSDSDGKVMNEGLWRYTRHPNYFGDFCVWWGIYLIAANANSWWTIASPILMTFLLLKVSGVALLEGEIEERRPEYAKYKRRTNAFFPGPVSAE